MTIRTTRMGVRRAAAAGAVLAGLLLAALAVSVAPASATTSNKRLTFLQFPAQVGDRFLASRTIMLRGTYRWRMSVAHVSHQAQPRVKTRTVRLRGRYEWVDLLLNDQGRYQHFSSLRNRRTGGTVVMDSQFVLGSFGDGFYVWGSTLDNVRAKG